MNLELWNNRTEDGQLTDDTESVYLDDVEWTAITYFGLSRVKFKNNEAMVVAQAATGWEEWDELTLEIQTHSNLVVANGKYYADWGTNA